MTPFTYDNIFSISVYGKGPLVFYLGGLSFCKLAICARKKNLISSKGKANVVVEI